MKSAVFSIFKKELKRFFSDRRLLLTTVFLPGIMIFVMYNFMGSAMSDLIGGEDPVYSVAAVNASPAVEAMAEAADITLTSINPDEIRDIKSNIQEGTALYDVLMVFPENFDADVALYDIASGEKAPSVDVFYNSSLADSSIVFSTLSAMLDGYEDTMINKFDINAGTDTYDLAAEEDFTGTIFAMLLPMLLLIFLYSGCMAVGIESIAGEKERGTVATLLVTPAKRSHIAMGKISALSIIALLSGASSAAGTLLSLPKLMGGAGEMLDSSVYTATDYVMLAVIILATVLVMITMISIISAFAKTVKEAQTYVTPLMVIVMVIGITGMFNGAQTNPVLYMIPLYNSVQSMVGIFSFDINYTNLIITFVSNIIFAGIGVFILTKLFDSEKVMFSR